MVPGLSHDVNLQRNAQLVELLKPAALASLDLEFKTLVAAGLGKVGRPRGRGMLPGGNTPSPTASSEPLAAVAVCTGVAGNQHCSNNCITCCLVPRETCLSLLHAACRSFSHSSCVTLCHAPRARPP